MFGQSFNFKSHMDVCKKKSVEATESDMDAWNDTGWETVWSKVRSGGDSVNIVELQ